MCFKNLKDYLKFIEHKKQGLVDSSDEFRFTGLFMKESQKSLRSNSWSSKKSYLKNGLRIVPVKKGADKS